jgi:hypothetical protein
MIVSPHASFTSAACNRSMALLTPNENGSTTGTDDHDKRRRQRVPLRGNVQKSPFQGLRTESRT